MLSLPRLYAGVLSKERMELHDHSFGGRLSLKSATNALRMPGGVLEVLKEHFKNSKNCCLDNVVHHVATHCGGLLLDHLRHHPSGASAAQYDFRSLEILMEKAVSLDDVQALEFFAAKLSCLPSDDVVAVEGGEDVDLEAVHVQRCRDLACRLLMAAAGEGRMQTLQLAVAGAAPGAPRPPSAAVHLLLEALPGLAPELLEKAVGEQQLAAVQLLARAGHKPTIRALCAAVWACNVEMVQLLLEGGRIEVMPSLDRSPEAPLFLPTETNLSLASYPCPVLAALQRRAQTWDPRVTELMQIMDCLVVAGYRPTVFRDVLVRRKVQGEAPYMTMMERFDPLLEDAALDVQGKNRYLLRGALRPHWSQAEHRNFMPLFKKAARTVLLAAKRLQKHGQAGAAGDRQAPPSRKRGADNAAVAPPAKRPCGEDLHYERKLIQEATLGDLSGELVELILGKAAYPLASWTPTAVAATSSAAADSTS